MNFEGKKTTTTRNEKFPAVGEACEAVFGPKPRLKDSFKWDLDFCMRGYPVADRERPCRFSEDRSSMFSVETDHVGF